MDDIYLDRPNLYIGFHGCEKNVGIDLILHPNRIHMSAHDYEWLGHGFYVWENHSVNDIAEGIPYFDSVRGAFTEGVPAYPGTQFGDKNHIQVCVRNKKCIKGFFLPRY